MPCWARVFSADEPMSIHHNISDHDATMAEIAMMVAMIADYEEDNGSVPSEPFEFTHPQYGTGIVDFNFAQPSEPVAVPAVCQNVFGRTSVDVDNVLQVSVQMGEMMGYESPYFGFSRSETTETLYYWAVGLSEFGIPEGSKLLPGREGPHHRHHRDRRRLFQGRRSGRRGALQLDIPSSAPPPTTSPATWAGTRRAPRSSSSVACRAAAARTPSSACATTSTPTPPAGSSTVRTR